MHCVMSSVCQLLCIYFSRYIKLMKHYIYYMSFGHYIWKTTLLSNCPHCGLTKKWLIYAISLLYGESLGTVQLCTIHKEVLPSRFLLLGFVDKQLHSLILSLSYNTILTGNTTDNIFFRNFKFTFTLRVCIWRNPFRLITTNWYVIC